MKHPDKWRETIDPFSLAYKSFHPIEILGYPHAGNDVFHARGIYKGKEVRAYIKAARQKGAAIENEVAILSQLHSPIYPTVLDCGFAGTPFSVTLELPANVYRPLWAKTKRWNPLALWRNTARRWQRSISFAFPQSQSRTEGFSTCRLTSS